MSVTSVRSAEVAAAAACLGKHPVSVTRSGRSVYFNFEEDISQIASDFKERKLQVEPSEYYYKFSYLHKHIRDLLSLDTDATKKLSRNQPA